MARTTYQLAPRYGKLRVLSERRVFGRRVVLVQCDCGDSKEVMADALNSGATQSCGKAACRGRTVKPVKNYTPRGTKVTTLPKLRRLFEQFSTGKTPGYALAARHKLNSNSLYSAFRAIQQAGGWDAYEALVQPTKRRYAGPATTGRKRHGSRA